MRQLHALRRRKRALLGLILIALLIPGSFGHVLAQDGDQEGVSPSLSTAPQIPEAASAQLSEPITEPVATQSMVPALAPQLFLPMIRGAELAVGAPSSAAEVSAAGVTPTEPATVQPAAPALTRRINLPMVSGIAGPPQLPSPAQALINVINVARAGVGCGALRVDGRLMQAAQLHSDDMARHANLSHEGSDGSMPADRVLAAGYPMSYVGETIYYEAASSAAAAAAHWLDSEPHRRILLRCSTKDVGAAGSASYWTMVVGNHF